MRWQDLTQDALDAAYNARATVPDALAYMQDYRRLSAPALQLPGYQQIAYGAYPDETMGYVSCGQANAPLFVFIHGGYWRALHQDDGLFMAQCFTQLGVNVVSLNYSLAPAVNLTKIVQQCWAALRVLCAKADTLGFDVNNIIVSGSSAGGHLAAALLNPATDLSTEPHQTSHIASSSTTAANPSIRKAMLVSGLFDLAPIQKTLPNAWLQMTDAEVQQLSPLHHLPVPSANVKVIVGGLETNEFKRQSAQYHGACVAHGCVSEYVEVAGRNHFDIILDWMQSGSQMTRLMQTLAAAP